MTITPTAITTPHQIHDAFQQAVNTHDLEALFAMYDSDGVVVQLDGSTCTGAEPMRAMCAGLLEGIRHIDATTRKLLVCGDIALSSASWTAEIVLPDGTVIQQSGTTAEVSQRQPDGTWRFLIDDPMFA